MINYLFYTFLHENISNSKTLACAWKSSGNWLHTLEAPHLLWIRIVFTKRSMVLFHARFNIPANPNVQYLLTHAFCKTSRFIDCMICILDRVDEIACFFYSISKIASVYCPSFAKSRDFSMTHDDWKKLSHTGCIEKSEVVEEIKIFEGATLK